ncbi:MAG: hypothetical protein COV74_03965 [Candidatus Omnitrophica bacterium CG11_big_fil_rev_8_21_14_0_20_45_26]|uniref:methylated-DNA--[protein]-cysteine S-methyltransferase n=1 Tax=Candidatus Abzuiibacterium crystallinum TaxID=1974748 RepID=A0A2H0LQB7_9BACT|nr:MAG: hypothetical protein COV74_03965 [Candidatus Omnitrophica bacterium CG11_big_fil_rev_8_21_14_0_20_45_26]PIW63282.1 MAG: hypothetical protein COW12_10925 [Candidatus Omnitrophica bacterium CG12_big_fil_rev_8_21_14_0_65_45_16]
MRNQLPVRLKKASVSDIRPNGKGLLVTAGFAKSPFGTCLIAESSDGICHLSFNNERKKMVSAIQKDWPGACIKQDDRYAANLVKRIFKKPNAKQAPLRLSVNGTPFQFKVWQSLLKVPQGKLISYGKLARLAGKPGAARAVGTAMAQNHVAFLIPCHRVIKSSGDLGHYSGGGPGRKKAIIAWEQTN